MDRRTVIRNGLVVAAASGASFAPAIKVAAGPTNLSPQTFRKFFDLIFSDSLVGLDLGFSAPSSATLNGSIEIGPGGSLSGLVSIDFGGGVDGNIDFLGDNAVASATGGTLDFNASGAQGELLFNSSPITVAEMVDDFVAAVQSGDSAAQWSPLARTALVSMALICIGTWRQNTSVAVREGDSAVEIWRKMNAAVSAGALLLLTAVGCDPLADACGGSDVITIGGMVLDCDSVLAACAAGSLTNGAGCYTYLLSAWDSGA